MLQGARDLDEEWSRQGSRLVEPRSVDVRHADWSGEYSDMLTGAVSILTC